MPFIRSSATDQNPWRGAVIGLAAGIAGTVAMGGYWSIATRLTGSDPRAATREGGPHALEDISLIGTHHGDDESTTAAMGRIAYTRLGGKPPEAEETASTLSYLVHYGYGATQGGCYGALTDGKDVSIVAGGLAFGTGLWIGGDELAGSLLGLAAGPGAFPVAQHLHRWGAHLTYGVAVALVTRLLRALV